MNSHTLQHNQPSHNGHISFANNMPQQEIAGTVLAYTAPDEFYTARLNDFTNDILGDLADGWIRLFEPQPDYQGENPIWWPENITLMKPHRMLKHGKRAAALLLSKLTHRRQSHASPTATLREVRGIFQGHLKGRDTEHTASS